MPCPFSSALTLTRTWPVSFLEHQNIQSKVTLVPLNMPRPQHATYSSMQTPVSSYHPSNTSYVPVLYVKPGIPATNSIFILISYTHRLKLTESFL